MDSALKSNSSPPREIPLGLPGFQMDSHEIQNGFTTNSKRTHMKSQMDLHGVQGDSHETHMDPYETQLDPHGIQVDSHEIQLDPHGIQME